MIKNERKFYIILEANVISCACRKPTLILNQKICGKKRGSKCFFSHGANNSRGVAIFCGKNLNIDIINVCRDDAGRFIMLQFKYNEEIFLLVNVLILIKTHQSFLED